MKHPRLTRPAAVALTVPEAVIDAVAFLLIGEGIEFYKRLAHGLALQFGHNRSPCR